MAKGNIAKQTLIDSIIKALPNNYLGEVDKKYYFKSTENGEDVQVCLTMTCPKTPLTVVRTSLNDDHDFLNEQNIIVKPEATYITEEEQKTIDFLMEKLK